LLGFIWTGLDGFGRSGEAAASRRPLSTPLGRRVPSDGARLKHSPDLGLLRPLSARQFRDRLLEQARERLRLLREARPDPQRLEGA